jgi:hypothetical protein
VLNQCHITNRCHRTNRCNCTNQWRFFSFFFICAASQWDCLSSRHTLRRSCFFYAKYAVCAALNTSSDLHSEPDVLPEQSAFTRVRTGLSAGKSGTAAYSYSIQSSSRGFDGSAPKIYLPVYSTPFSFFSISADQNWPSKSTTPQAAGYVVL